MSQWCKACGCHFDWKGCCPECCAEPPDDDGQPDEAQEWQDFDPDC